MNSVILKEIDESNFIDAFNLELAKGQERFVSNPVRSLAQAYVYRKQCMPFAIYSDDIMVGYVMVIYDYDLEEYNIWHMMIDKKHQHKGYAKQAMIKCLEYIKSKPFGESSKVVLTCNKENEIANHLYTQLGFVKNQNEDEDEIEMELYIHE